MCDLCSYVYVPTDIFEHVGALVHVCRLLVHVSTCPHVCMYAHVCMCVSVLVCFGDTRHEVLINSSSYWAAVARGCDWREKQQQSHKGLLCQENQLGSDLEKWVDSQKF